MFRSILSAFILLLSNIVFSQQLQVVNLRCNNHQHPLGIEKQPPRFSWEILTDLRGVKQSAFQLIVADDVNKIISADGNLWNSGKVKTDQSINVEYKGKQFTPAKKYYWKVKLWDSTDKSYWSGIDSFSTGLYNQQDWGDAKWIGLEDLPDSLKLVPGIHAPQAAGLGSKALKHATVPIFRKEFEIKKRIKSATAFISGLGQYELYINGEKTGNSFLAPGWTNYDKRVLYNTYDVTNVVRQGANAVGVIVGNGFHNINRERYFKLVTAFGAPKLICKIKIDFEDGSGYVVSSDDTWKSAPSPIIYSSIYGGEDYDARLEQQGWNSAGFNDSGWKNAIMVKPPEGSLQPENIFPVTIQDQFNPKTITEVRPGIFIYDFGQNASGIIELKVKGKKGQTIRFTPSELLTKEKLANQNASGAPYYFSYTLKGDNTESWRPSFTYYGFRYVQVEGAVPDTAENTSGLPEIISLKELHNSSSSPVSGTFTCSNELFNKINTLIRWAIQSNLQSVVTDCPHREKLSWLEQDYLMGKSIHYNKDVFHLYKKLVNDMRDAQTKDGLVPDIAPEFVVFENGFRDSPEWGSAAVILPWLIYKWYGDPGIIRDAYPMMKRYVEYLQNKSDNHILSHGLGDWFDYGPREPGEAQLTPRALTATAIYYYDVRLLSEMADLIGRKQDVFNLKSQASEIKKAFNAKFYNPSTKVYSTGSQTAMAMPLCVGLVDDQNKPAVYKNLVDSINLSGKKLTAGDVGYHFLVEALHNAGASQLLFDMNFREDVPGYGFQLKKGATALTESWPALEEVSNNHLMLGHIMEWFYSGIAGIDQAETSVAYKEIIIRPEVVGTISSAKGTFHSPYGLISSEWKKNSDSFELAVTIPANTSATIYFPVGKVDTILSRNTGDRILVDGKPLGECKDARLLSIKEGIAMIKLGSGNYRLSFH